MAAPSYEFLSPEWLEAARSVRAAHGDPPAPTDVTMNLRITDAPFSHAPVEVYLDTRRGVLALSPGRLASAEITIGVDWATAKALLVSGDQQAAMSAFLSGKVTVEGDMAKLLALAQGPRTAASEGVIEGLREITA